jgi:hypothetical protein
MLSLFVGGARGKLKHEINMYLYLTELGLIIVQFTEYPE